MGRTKRSTKYKKEKAKRKRGFPKSKTPLTPKEKIPDKEDGPVTADLVDRPIDPYDDDGGLFFEDGYVDDFEDDDMLDQWDYVDS